MTEKTVTPSCWPYLPYVTIYQWPSRNLTICTGHNSTMWIAHDILHVSHSVELNDLTAVDNCIGEEALRIVALVKS
jgi:hypothetical protein